MFRKDTGPFLHLGLLGTSQDRWQRNNVALAPMQ